MKNIFLVIVLLSVNNLFSQIKKLYSIPQYRTVTTYHYSDVTEYIGGSTSLWQGDTILKGKLYTKVDDGSFFVREDSIVDSLYVINSSGIEFSAPVIRNLNVGDTVKVYNWYFSLFWGEEVMGSWDNDYEIAQISYVEQIMINGNPRNKYYFSGIDMEYIEGIGITSYIFLSGVIQMECFFEKNNLVFENYSGKPLEDPYSTIIPCNSININDIYVGENDLSLQSPSFYPNPTSGILKFNLSQITQIEVYSVSGQNMGVYNLSGSSILDLSHLKKGVYFLANKYSLRTQKLIIK